MIRFSIFLLALLAFFSLASPVFAVTFDYGCVLDSYGSHPANCSLLLKNFAGVYDNSSSSCSLWDPSITWLNICSFSGDPKAGSFPIPSSDSADLVLLSSTIKDLSLWSISRGIAFYGFLAILVSIRRLFAR